MEIDEKLILDMQKYIFIKTGKQYFSRIKVTSDDIMVSCPFHKDGQERKPSCGIKRYSNESGNIGTVHCFSCGKITDIGNMLKELLGPMYDDIEVENKFGISSIINSNIFLKPKRVLFSLPEKDKVNIDVLRKLDNYHPYLLNRGISEQTALKYNIKFDRENQHILFPIKNINNICVGVGRRSVLKKEYFYPSGMVKPLYGLYELNQPVRALYVVEGPFNLWSLSEWGKHGVALLGTGTAYQYAQLINAVKCDMYVLALDPDNAGRKGIEKLGSFLIKNNKKVYVADLPDGRDVNDLSKEEFRYISVLTFNEWYRKYVV